MPRDYRLMLVEDSAELSDEVFAEALAERLRAEVLAEVSDEVFAEVLDEASGPRLPVARLDAFFSSSVVAFWWAAPCSLMRSWARSRPNLRSVMNCPLAFSMALLLAAGTPAWPTAPAPA